jgi:hypothetical protein
MVNDPRSPIPGSSNPQEPRDPLDLLRELARNRAPEPPHPEAAPGRPGPGDEKLASLRELAESLNRQLRAQPGAAPQPPYDPSAYSPSDPAAYLPYDPGGYPPQDAMPPEPPPQPSRPTPRGGHGTWLRTAQFEWAAFCDGLPPARTLVPRWRVPEIVFVAVAGVVLAAAGVGALIHHRGAPPASETMLPPVPSTFPAPGAVPAGEDLPPPSVADVRKSMSECDAAAAKDPDSLNFLVLPLLRTNPADAWTPAPLQTIGSAYMLIGANDALDGMRDGKLKVRPGRYTFAVLDMVSGTTYSWTSATQIARLARKDPSGMKTLKLGFDFSASQIGPQWSAEIQRARGTCYWVNVLVR